MFGLTSKKKVTEILDQKAEEIQSMQLKTSRAENALTENNQLNRALFQMLYSNTIVPYQAEATAFIDKGYCYNPHLYTVINFIGRNLSQVIFKPYKITDRKRKRLTRITPIFAAFFLINSFVPLVAPIKAFFILSLIPTSFCLYIFAFIRFRF